MARRIAHAFGIVVAVPESHLVTSLIVEDEATPGITIALESLDEAPGDGWALDEFREHRPTERRGGEQAVRKARPFIASGFSLVALAR